jgi:EAL domain-containing protein (putative c-di-GMP-specific phosphodiesterase class I)
VPELRRAIEQDELTVHYQPKVALATRELIGVECLVRWQHPEQGLLMPGEFVPVAEHTGLIGPLTRWVLKNALAECRRWQDLGRPLGVSVNLSARTLQDPDFPDDLDQLLAEAGVPPGQLTLEIIEGGALTDAERPLATLRRLAERGVRLSLDDFGVGTSAFSYLRTIPVHEIKIDRSFVLGMNTDAADLGIVRSIVGLGQHLGLSVVAEGVESERALAHLEEMGCDIAQGFLFARPLPPDRLDSWVAARTEASGDPSGGAGPSEDDVSGVDGGPDEATRRLRVVGQHG